MKAPWMRTTWGGVGGTWITWILGFCAKFTGRIDRIFMDFLLPWNFSSKKTKHMRKICGLKHKDHEWSSTGDVNFSEKSCR